MQGVLFSKPVPPKQLADLLRPTPLLISRPLSQFFRLLTWGRRSTLAKNAACAGSMMAWRAAADHPALESRPAGRQNLRS
jgi:hypothetical protein